MNLREGVRQIKEFSRNLEAKNAAKILLAFAFLFKFSLIVWQFADGHFIVAPGGDPLSHLGIIQNIMEGKIFVKGYPPLFHLIITSLAKITGADVLALMKVAAIFLLFLPVWVIYKFTIELFDFWSAFFATMIFLLASPNPFLGFIDGNYPDMLNYGLFIPFGFLFLIKALKEKAFANSLKAAAFFSLMLFTHHLTATFTLIIIIFFFLTVALMRRLDARYLNDSLKNFPSVAKVFLFYSIIGYFILRMTFGGFLLGVINSIINFQSPISNFVFSTPISYEDMAYLLSPLIEFGGIFGLIILLLDLKKNSAPKILLAVWVFVLWVLSRTELSGLAPRYLRELSLPLSIAAGTFVAYLLSLTQNRWQKIVLGAITGFLIYTNMVQVTFPPFTIGRGGFRDMVWFKDNDQEKADYLKNELPESSVIIANPSNPYLPYFIKKNNKKKIDFRVIQSPPKINPKLTNDLKDQVVAEFLESEGANYLFIGAAPISNVDENTFSEFNGYHYATYFFNQFEYYPGNVVKNFNDGSKLILVKR